MVWLSVLNKRYSYSKHLVTCKVSYDISDIDQNVSMHISYRSNWPMCSPNDQFVMSIVEICLSGLLNRHNGNCPVDKTSICIKLVWRWPYKVGEFYDMVGIFQNTQNRCSIAHLLWWDMMCLLWVHSLSYVCVSFFSLLLYGTTLWGLIEA